MFITVCHLELHDYLFYASREMGRLYETEKYLHNYGLTYALGMVKSPFTNLAQVPHYQEDLAVMNEQGVYVTPAHPLRYAFAFHTFKMSVVDYYTVTPKVSTNQVVFGRSKELTPESIFEFFVLSPKKVSLPRWVRLGKWMAKASISVRAQMPAQEKEGDFLAHGAVNPLDIEALPQNCNVVAMAPASLLTHAAYSGRYYEIAAEKQPSVCLPAGMSYLHMH